MNKITIKPVRCTVNIPLETVIQLDKHRDKSNLSRSAWISNVIQDYFDTKNDISTELKELKEEVIEIKKLLK